MDVYKKRHPDAAEQTLVRVGRVTTAVIVVVSILWIPFIQFMNSEIYQYLQSIQASLAAPITAVLRIVFDRFETTRPVAGLLAGRLPGEAEA